MISFSEDRIVVTEDKDFGELVFRLRRPAKGIVLLRFDEQEQAAKIPRLSEFVAREKQRLQGMFVVLEADKTRIRPLQPR